MGINQSQEKDKILDSNSLKKLQEKCKTDELVKQLQLKELWRQKVINHLYNINVKQLVMNMAKIGESHVFVDVVTKNADEEKDEKISRRLTHFCPNEYQDEYHDDYKETYNTFLSNELERYKVILETKHKIFVKVEISKTENGCVR
jgi:hypothetical protein